MQGYLHMTCSKHLFLFLPAFTMFLISIQE